MRTSGIFLSNFGTTHRCTSCGHQKTHWSGIRAKDGASYSLLGTQSRHEDDAEANAGLDQVNSGADPGPDDKSDV